MMKKFFDRYLFSRTGLLILFSIGVIVLCAFLATYLRANIIHSSVDATYENLFWGFRQITDDGSVSETLDKLDSVSSGGFYTVMGILGVTLGAWLIGLVLYSFVTGAIVNAFDSRRSKIEEGETRYHFKGHGVVIGWDFQGVSAVKNLLEQWELKEVLVVSEIPAEEIRLELSRQLPERELGRIFIYHLSYENLEHLKELQVELAKVVIILGDTGCTNNDSGNMAVAEKLMQKIIGPYYDKKKKKPEEPVKIYISLDSPYNSRLWSQVPTLGKKACGYYQAYTINYFESAINQLFASLPRIATRHTKRHGVDSTYRPLMFRENPQADHCDIFVSGINDMAKTLALRIPSLLTLTKRKHRLFVCSSDTDQLEQLRHAFPFDKLIGVDVSFVPEELCQGEQILKQLKDAVLDMTASVTVFITGDIPDEAMSDMMRLPKEVLFENALVITEKRVFDNQVPQWATPYLRAGFKRHCGMGLLDYVFHGLEETYALNHVLFDPKDFSTERQKFFARDFSNSILAKLQAVDCEFTFDSPDETRPRITEFTDEQLDRLVLCEHMRNVNFKLLNGVRYDDRTDENMNSSDELVPWNEVSDKQKEAYRNQIKKILPAIAAVYGTGESPFCVVSKEQGPRQILGVVGQPKLKEEERYDFAWQISERGFKGKNRFYQSCVTHVKTQKQAKNYYSGSILMIPDDEAAYTVFTRIYSLKSATFMAVLPCEPKDYEMQFKTEGARKRFQHFMRCVDYYHVLPGATRQEMEQFIYSRSNQLLKLEECDVNELKKENRWTSGDYERMPRRKVTQIYTVLKKDDAWSVDFHDEAGCASKG